MCGGGGVVVGKPNLVKCFGPRLRLWTWTLDFVPGPSFSIIMGINSCVFSIVIETVHKQKSTFKAHALLTKIYLENIPGVRLLIM